jgi:hypothetical protein
MRPQAKLALVFYLSDTEPLPKKAQPLVVVCDDIAAAFAE